MAATTIADILIPSVWNRYLSEKTAELTALLSGGAVVADAVLRAKIAGGGKTFDLPFWKDLANSTANISSAAASASTPNNITADEQIAVRLMRNNSWAAYDLLESVTGEDPMGQIITRVAAYWARQDQETLISILKGIEADNVANDASDMVSDVGTDVASASVAAEQINDATIIDCKLTAGDAGQMFNLICMHSQQKSELDKLQLVKDEPVDAANAAGVRFQTYMGMRVIVDDAMPITVGTNRTKYTNYLLKLATFARGDGSARVPVAVEREEAQGDGGGLETLHSRVEFALHPYGFQYTASAAGQSPTNAEMEAAGAWDRVFERKNIGIAILKTNPIG